MLPHTLPRLPGEGVLAETLAGLKPPQTSVFGLLRAEQPVRAGLSSQGLLEESPKSRAASCSMASAGRPACPSGARASVWESATGGLKIACVLPTCDEGL